MDQIKSIIINPYKLITLWMRFTSGLILIFLGIAASANNNCLIYSSLQCSQCAQGYFLSTNFTCLSCPTGCSQCLSASQCTNCYSNYLLTNFLCEQGPMNCLQVNANTGACVQCLLGFFLDGTECAVCPSYCVNCTMTQCLKCSLGFGIDYDANQTCYVCSGGCVNCETSNSQSSCLNCPLGSYIFGNTCQPCESYCASCSSSPTNCSACILGYYLEAYLCTACPNGCLSCISSTLCTACSAQFYLSQTHACVACGQQCYNCTQDECTSCITNYYLSNGSCIHCGTACTECTSTGCLSCSDSYYNNGGVCTLCPSYCATCQSPSQCQSCTSIQNTTYAGQCVPCNSVLGGCSTCSSAFNCLTCQSGYSFQDGNCYQEDDGLAVGYIVLIVFGCLFIVAIIGYAIYAFWNRRKGFMGPEAVGDGNSIKSTYYQIP